MQAQPQQPKKQKPPKDPNAKKTGPVPFIALGISVVALILAIVGFVLPNLSTSNNDPSVQNWKYAKLSDSFTIDAGTSVKLPAGYPTAGTDNVLITGYGNDGLRFTQIVPGVNVSIVVPNATSTVDKLTISTTDGIINNPTSQNITITGIYKIVIQ